ncbi:acyltransferase [uncultured Dokdonia sp.]|uniref:acyltransferase family protein n=1 Tax=uncultured Dokdonia sp. TaxID=575653 RepID=UPI002613733A|nr:acyltransferase [uncultured Dokdonia sp.]
MKKLPNLTPIRFFLATFVLLFHVPQLSKNQGLPYFNNLPMFHRGTEAVYMFFVLSGFLIIRLIYKEKQRDSFSIRKFYIRRILRILPLYYFIVLFGFLFYQFLLPLLNIPYENNYDLSTGLALTVFFLPNVFASYQPGGVLEVLWSIGIEEQFYLIIAPLLYFLNKKKILLVLSGIFFSYIIIYHTKDFYTLRKYHFIYFFMLSGGIMAILEEKEKLDFLKKIRLIPIIIITCTFLFFFTDLFLIDHKFLYNGITCILFTLFIYTVSHLNFNIEIKSKLLNHLGNISYGIYMYHIIALNIIVFIFLKIQKMNIISDTVSIILLNISTLVLTILISHISYTYFESYFLKIKNKYRIK